MKDKDDLSRDGILGHQFNKRLENFLLLAIQTSFILLVVFLPQQKNPTEKPDCWF
jgi:hypothetical protein